jgi:hypothetical protein
MVRCAQCKCAVIGNNVLYVQLAFTNLHPTILLHSDHVKYHPHLLRKVIVILMLLIGYGPCYMTIALIRESKPKNYGIKFYIPFQVGGWTHKVAAQLRDGSFFLFISELG